MPRALPFLLASAALALTAAPAFAEPEIMVRTEVVRYGDLNLNDPLQTDILLDRIHSASRRVCDDGPNLDSLSERRVERECRSDSENRAVADTNDSRVIARFHGVTPEIIISENEYADPVYKK